jgi:hypothetical protein
LGSIGGDYAVVFVSTVVYSNGSFNAYASQTGEKSEFASQNANSNHIGI